jgi:translocation and assembly module TamB
MNTRETHFLVSPDLHLALDGRRLDVSGEVTIPEGMIDYDQPVTARVVKPSADVFYSGADSVARGPLDVRSKVRVIIGDQVEVHTFGLAIKPTGSVLATDGPGLPTLGTGELDVKNGTYRIYGQELTVESGRLIFGGGPIANPAIRARASRTASDGVIAGFDVGGTLQKPDVQIFSQPAMGQSEALSYIMFGQPLEKSNLSQGQLASTMATGLGVSGSNLVAHGIASQVGIEEARVQAGSSFQNAALQLGTSLSPKLYVSYGVGLFETMSALRMRYLLSSRWTIEAETSRQNRVDFLYTVEK